MRKEVSEKFRMFRVYNDITLQNEIVIYGSTFTAEFPFYELSQKYLLSNAIYNRSIPGLSLKEAEVGLESCVLEIRPKKIFLSLGEQDLQTPDALDIYGRILQQLRSRLPDSSVYVMPVRGCSPVQAQFNRKLRSLCGKYGAVYLDLLYRTEKGELSCSSIFKQLSSCFRKTPLTLTEALQLGQ